MSPSATDDALVSLAAFGFPASTSITFLNDAGGFSGARLWRVSTAAGEYCLKVWPSGLSAERLSAIHTWQNMARDAGLSFIPSLCVVRNGLTFVSNGGAVWEMAEWMTGQVCEQVPWPEAKVRSACEKLAQLHRAWSGIECGTAVPESVARRQRFFKKWSQLLATGWRPTRPPHDDERIAVLLDSLWQHLHLLLPQIPESLAPWLSVPQRLFPCLCDIRQSHVLFHGDDATGIVDFGSARVDSPAADLARLLGDTIQNNDALWHCGVDEYRRFASLTDTEIRLARTLDATGAVLSAATWLEWLLMDRRSFPDSEQVFRRLLHLQQRLKQMTSGELRILLSTAETR